VTVFPTLNTPVQHFPFLPIHKNIPARLFPIILTPETTSSSTCFVFPLPLLQHRAQQFFPLLKHQQTFHFLPVAETPCQQPFVSLPDAETPLFSIFHSFHSCHLSTSETIPSSNCFALFVAETPLLSNPLSLSPSIIDETIPSSNRFASSVAETRIASNPSSFIHDAETPLFSTL
jgi:hypothetical protein